MRSWSRTWPATGATPPRPSAHIVLSWGDGENPRDAEIMAAARMAVQDLGAERHQHVMAIHPDRLNLHAHIVLNLVHPISGKTLSMRHDYARLELACRRIEHRFGWPPDRGRFDQTIIDGEVRLVSKPQAHWDAKREEREAGLRPDPQAPIDIPPDAVGWRDDQNVYLLKGPADEELDETEALWTSLAEGNILKPGGEKRSLQFKMPASQVRSRPRCYRLDSDGLNEGLGQGDLQRSVLRSNGSNS